MPATTSIPWARRCCRWGWWGRTRPVRRSGDSLGRAGRPDRRHHSVPARPTPVKTRILGGGWGSRSARQQIVRVDREPEGAIPPGAEDVARRAAPRMGGTRGRGGPVGLRLRHGHPAHPGRDPGARRARGHRDGRLAVRPPPVRAAHRRDPERVGGRAHPGNVARWGQGRGAGGLAAPRATRLALPAGHPRGERAGPVRARRRGDASSPSSGATRSRTSPVRAIPSSACSPWRSRAGRGRWTPPGCPTTRAASWS